MSEDGFGALLRARRSGAGLTQEELAERSGLSVRAIRDLEHGRVARPRRETLRLLATALGLPEDEGEELLRLARQALPPARSGHADAEEPPAPPTTAPTDHDDPQPSVVPPDEPDTPPKAQAACHPAAHTRGRGPAARYGILLTALLTVTTLSSDRGPLPTLPSHHSPHASRTTLSSDRGPLPTLPSHHSPHAPRTTNRAAYVARIGNGDVRSPYGPMITGADLQVLHAVTRGQTLIVTIALTGAGSGAVTVTDTAGNRYRPAGQINDRGRLLLFAVIGAKPLDTLDQITIRWPKATVATTEVDAFRKITAAGPWIAAEPGNNTNTSSESINMGDLPLCTEGDLFFTAMNAPNGPAPQFDPPWQETPWQPVDPSPRNATLTTAYRSIASTESDCMVHGTATPPWLSITLRLHTQARPGSTH
ncbi:helix-turn-helix transcriptional regulator [Streptomyces sp. BK340]|uniref:helix-turn-helix domain-containing protein n=1 Tax=Streptomyces sp. BK340 TaxID=2572903 RepID=UPI0011A881B4|nr:helix-turn-helix transcriptional regulator [Streptomyces sp. BK340]TVZ77980.1 helix-turn-helix protein [Streptomyces sp. BK340]